jgi:hypothetical protein
MLIDELLTAEISYCGTREPLPTKASATWAEGERVLIHRAQRLIDLYLGSRLAGLFVPVIDASPAQGWE